MKLVVMVKMAKPVILMVMLIQLNFVIMVNILQSCRFWCFSFKFTEKYNIFFQILLLKASILLSDFAWNRDKKVLLLFLFGTESCVFSKLCKWWRRGGGGKLRRRCCVSSFSNCYFSDKMNQNRLIQYKNSYFLLSIFKNRLKWIKNPSLHDSQ